MLTAGGYVTEDVSRGTTGGADGSYWVPSEQQVFDASGFYQVTQVKDPFNQTYDITFDSYKLLPAEVEDPVGNTDSADIDYRVLASWKVTDENDNRSAVKYDGLGLVVATAVMGKDGAGEGDTLTDPTTEVEYDLFEWKDSQKPVWVHTKAREQHGGTATWLESYSYSDGLGREISRKVEAEPGDAPYVDAQGQLQIEEDADPRWVGTGRTVFDNKGNPVKQYEPFFSTTHEFENEDDLVNWGVTPVLTYDPLGRVIRTDFPDDTFSKVEFDTWKQVTWDQNDTVDQTTWYSDRIALSSGDPDRRAAELADDHAGTPTETYLDPLGRPFLTREDKGSSSSHDWVDTRLELDIEGNTLVVKDALSRDALTTDYSVAGEPMHTDSIDAGEHWVLDDVAGEEIYTWDSRNYRVRTTYDSLRRPTGIWVQQGAGTEYQREKLEYGEGETDPKDDNLRGQLVRHYDGAGSVQNDEFDFKGNLLSSTRQVTTVYTSQPDWSATPAPTLSTETFTIEVTYDALNRPVETTLPDDTVLRSGYNNAGLLETVDAKIRGATSWTDFVTGIDYNARGQRLEIDYDSGVTTTYTYDPLTFRLATLTSTRPTSTDLQELSYFYDAVGNIVEVQDAAQETVYFNNSQVSPDAKYEYDPLYRLVEGKGREHARTPSVWQPDHTQFAATGSIPNNDALRLYTETYSYDDAGNISQMQHVATNGNWTRIYSYVSGTNRLSSTSPSVSYSHDASGNMTDIGPHVDSVTYDHEDQMIHVHLTASGENVYFAYDGGGQRVRKVYVHSSHVDERIYLGPYEVFRKKISGSLDTERQTVHVMDDTRRVAMVETKTWASGSQVSSPTPRYRYQLDNHLGTACVETDENAAIISYEEYHPYGTTAHRAKDSGVDVSEKRYRYTGKERDEETGLYYHGARYYAPWLGRWTATDPAGVVDGVCLYSYAQQDPINGVDSTGLRTERDTFCTHHLDSGESLHPVSRKGTRRSPPEPKASKDEARRDEPTRGSTGASTEKKSSFDSGRFWKRFRSMYKPTRCSGGDHLCWLKAHNPGLKLNEIGQHYNPDEAAIAGSYSTLFSKETTSGMAYQREWEMVLVQGRDLSKRPIFGYTRVKLGNKRQNWVPIPRSSRANIIYGVAHTHWMPDTESEWKRALPMQFSELDITAAEYVFEKARHVAPGNRFIGRNYLMTPAYAFLMYSAQVKRKFLLFRGTSGLIRIPLPEGWQDLTKHDSGYDIKPKKELAPAERNFLDKIRGRRGLR